MSNKTFLLLEVVENTIETMTTSSSFEDILNDALVYADQYVEAKYSEGEIDNWKELSRRKFWRVSPEVREGDLRPECNIRRAAP